MKATCAVIIFMWMLIGFIPAPAQDSPAGVKGWRGNVPLGRWRTVDDVTGKVRSVVSIWEDKGVLFGRIEELLDLDPHISTPRCVHCSGESKDKPLMGLRIIWNLSRNGNQWSGGEILDPDSGKTYRCSIELADGGKKLKVRGFIGVSLFGRTQYWLRDQ